MSSSTIDLTDTIVPKSDQMNADDLMSGPRTFTIKEVRKSSSDEQPVDVYLAEFPQGRPFKPSKSMRRVMVNVWGPDAATYKDKRLTLYRDPAVRFGGQDVGGIRISHMSGIDKPMKLALTVTRGKREPYVVKPLADETPTSPAVSPELLAELTTTFDRKGIPDDARLAGVNHITGGSATALEVITEDQARQVLAALAKRPDVAEPATGDEHEHDPATEYDPTDDPEWQDRG